MTTSEVIGKNFLELVDNIRAVRNDSIVPGIGLITFPQLKLLRVLTRQFPDGARLKELAGELRLTPGYTLRTDMLSRE